MLDFLLLPCQHHINAGPGLMAKTDDNVTMEPPPELGIFWPTSLCNKCAVDMVLHYSFKVLNWQFFHWFSGWHYAGGGNTAIESSILWRAINAALMESSTLHRQMHEKPYRQVSRTSQRQHPHQYQ